jgi:UDP-N-acetylmuramoyl-L-alanyl-D-glutamate--2,6-diaminopimelate ligase
MTQSIKLSALLRSITAVPTYVDREISGLALDSRQVKPGQLFFACRGTHLDGRQYIDEVIAKGVGAIVAEARSAEDTAYYLQHHVPIFPVIDLNHRISRIAANFYHQPAAELDIVGITGTNGKTSCSHFIAAALQQLGTEAGVIGTLGSGIYGKIEPSLLTTPDAITLQATFANFVQQKAKVAVMEVSSHSLDQGRVDDVSFAVGVFTNLTRDHLDYHGTMEAYGLAKKRLFEQSHVAVINHDDDFGKTIIESLPRKNTTYAYSLDPAAKTNVPLIYADQLQLDLSGVHARVHTPWGEGDLHVPLIGRFNVSNLLAVLTTLCVLEVPLPQALKSLASLQPVPGRMQTLGGDTQPLVVVDYSHTPDALEKVLLALRQHCQGRLYCVFGCGGDRDRGKRPMMARIAEQYADQVMVTDDNPRHESPEQIVQDIVQGFSAPDKVSVQHDRSKAIQEIIQCAVAGDCILIAGKGAETYQQIGDARLPFSDVEQVKQNLIVPVS